MQLTLSADYPGISSIKEIASYDPITKRLLERESQVNEIAFYDRPYL